METDSVLSLYNRPETVFTFDTIAQMNPTVSPKNLRNRLYRAVVLGKLKRLARGVYAKKTYDHLELATKIYTPSYVSLETVLAQYGVVFQHYDSIFVVSYVTRSIVVDGKTIQLRKIHDSILTNAIGIERKNGYYIANRERALLDAIYLYKNYHFDNLGSIDWEKVEQYKRIYTNAAFNKRVESYYKDFKKDYGKH